MFYFHWPLTTNNIEWCPWNMWFILCENVSESLKEANSNTSFWKSPQWQLWNNHWEWLSSGGMNTGSIYTEHEEWSPTDRPSLHLPPSVCFQSPSHSDNYVISLAWLAHVAEGWTRQTAQSSVRQLVQEMWRGSMCCPCSAMSSHTVLHG
jgi:hypothetical protein